LLKQNPANLRKKDVKKASFLLISLRYKNKAKDLAGVDG
jgi:hypothetical protein